MVSALTHADALRMLVEYSQPLDQIKAELGKHPFDTNECLFVITPAHMRDILEAIPFRRAVSKAGGRLGEPI
jgi:hypothetical protein